MRDVAVRRDLATEITFVFGAHPELLQSQFTLSNRRENWSGSFHAEMELTANRNRRALKWFKFVESDASAGEVELRRSLLRLIRDIAGDTRVSESQFRV